MKKPILFKFYLLLVLLSILSFNVYASHEGSSTISWNENTKSIEIVHRFATHDFEITLSKQLQKTVSAKKKHYESIIRDYIDSHFALIKNNRRLNISWVSIDAGANETIIHQEIPQARTLTNIFLYNEILSDFFPKQINRVNYDVQKIKGVLIFTSSETIQAMASNP